MRKVGKTEQSTCLQKGEPQVSSACLLPCLLPSSTTISGPLSVRLTSMGTPRVDTAQPNSGHIWIPSGVRTAHQHLKNSANFFFQYSFPEMDNMHTSVLWGLWYRLLSVLPTTASALNASFHIYWDAVNSVALSFSPLVSPEGP